MPNISRIVIGAAAPPAAANSGTCAAAPDAAGSNSKRNENGKRVLQIIRNARHQR